MLRTFESLKKAVHYKGGSVVIDNLVFKLHYRVTFAVLVASCIIVSAHQFVGEPISCVADDRRNIRVINRFCFFSSTFTVPGVEGTAHPGVGPYVPGRDPARHHAYYQWVPFFWFLQALLFYAPHYAWRALEGGRMRQLVQNLQVAHLDLHEEDARRIAAVRHVFLNRLHVVTGWSRDLVLCELLNATLLGVQIAATRWFLGPIWEVTFPRVTKCTFHKYGPSGTIELHDAMCVLPLNLVHEWLFSFLFVWYAFLCVATVAGLFWRVATFVLHARSDRFNLIAFSLAHPQLSELWARVRVTGERHFSDWLFLYYLAKNLDPLLFRDLFLSLAAELD